MYVRPVALAVDDLDEGRQVFLANCAGCHGQEANGRSIAGQSLRPVAFNLAGFLLSDDLIWRVLQTGVPGSAMPSWDRLPSAEFRAVADYVAFVGHANGLSASQRDAPDPVLMEAGKRVFQTHCARCHGMDAGGDGPDGLKMRPRPANFHELMPSYPAAAYVLHHGVPGSGMLAWPLLTPPEIQAVTYYLRSFYSGPQPPVPAHDAFASTQKEGPR